ncbi:MAG: TAXI family TRAP transporter solute-binding subunit [Alphaproteobacteria bacterium]|nr:TAXI family TRAP transporter solute-binding subunit [Alphaproteobacteria bacterium]
MKRRTFGLTAAATAASTLLVGSPVARAQETRFFRIGTGGAGGTYFPIGGLMANAISAPPGSTPCDQGGACGVPGLVAIAQTTNASVANVTGVQGGQMESGLAAADIVYQSVNGLGRFDRKFDRVRVIANLFPEHMHLVLPKGGKLGGIKDLKGKRVGIFTAGSGTQVVVLELFKIYGIAKSDIQAAELNPQQSADRMADGQLDAFFIVGGTPLAAIAQLAATKGIELYELSAQERADFLKAVPYYYEDVIKAGTYEGQRADIKTVAVGAQWVVGSTVPDQLVYDITKALWNDNSRRLFDAGHAKARDIQLASALKAVNTPLHAGAERFYKEKGLIK